MTPTSPWFSKELNRTQYDRRNLGVGGLTPNDRHGSCQVVSSTNGDVAIDNPTVGLSDTLIAANADVEVVSETKYVFSSQGISFDVSIQLNASCLPIFFCRGIVLHGMSFEVTIFSNFFSLLVFQQMLLFLQEKEEEACATKIMIRITRG